MWYVLFLMHSFLSQPHNLSAHTMLFLNETNSTHIQYKHIGYNMVHYISFAVSWLRRGDFIFLWFAFLSLYLHLPFSSNDKFMYNKHTQTHIFFVFDKTMCSFIRSSFNETLTQGCDWITFYMQDKCVIYICQICPHKTY